MKYLLLAVFVTYLTPLIGNGSNQRITSACAKAMSGLISFEASIKFSHPNAREIALRLVKEYKEFGVLIPINDPFIQVETKFHNNWAKNLSVTDFPEHKNIELDSIYRNSEVAIPDIYRGNVDSNPMIIRTFTATKSASNHRKEVAASLLQRMLNLKNIVPLSRFAKINGSLAVVSYEALGNPLLKIDYNNLLATQPLWFSELLDFQFLAGQTDGHFGNTIFSDDRVIVFDHDLAFKPLIPDFDVSSEIPLIGSILPRRHSSDFISNLKRATSEVITKKFNSLLSPEEIKGLLFRRSVILRSAAL